MKLKYGMNPYQDFAEVEIPAGKFDILNGEPSYINFLDALNGWQLVKELKACFGLPAASSFKHVTPSGAALGIKLSGRERKAYFAGTGEPTLLASAYLRARGSDRLASFGDFIALSDIVDAGTAAVIRTEVSSGIIAPGYEPEALAILKKKQGGKFVIFTIDPGYEPPETEEREIFGFRLVQKRNNAKITFDTIRKVLTGSGEPDDAARRDMVLGLITLKYTQSNSICIVHNGQAVGIGSGQQSRILCTGLALDKTLKWFLKLQDDALGIVFPERCTKTEKDQIVESFVATHHRDAGYTLLKSIPGLVLCSDGYFPQTDNIELANQAGIRYIAEPAGSVKDPEVIKKCEEYGIVLIDTGMRLFHH
jgi:phosphoribosylaminoimidazolecarboxamide formyltransferase / IMP cyclohydrolase